MSSSHYRDLRGREHPKESWIVCTATHSIVSGAVACSQDCRDFGYVGIRYGADQFSTVLGDALLLKLLADHEARDVLKEDERNLALTAKLDKVSSFKGTLREKNTIIGYDANWMPIKMTEASDERIAVVLLKLMESAPIEDSRQNGVHVERLLMVDRNDSIQVLNRVERLLWLNYVLSILGKRIVNAQVFYDGAG